MSLDPSLGVSELCPLLAKPSISQLHVNGKSKASDSRLEAHRHFLPGDPRLDEASPNQRPLHHCRTEVHAADSFEVPWLFLTPELWLRQQCLESGATGGNPGLEELSNLSISSAPNPSEATSRRWIAPVDSS